MLRAVQPQAAYYDITGCTMFPKYGGFRMSGDDHWKYVVMSSVTEDPDDPRVKYGEPDIEQVPQNEIYLVLPEAERSQSKFQRPYREAYWHSICEQTTTISQPIAQSYARNPKFYQSTYCVHCMMHRPVNEFLWVEGNGEITNVVGS
jgi:hypothetical protein